MSSFRDEIAEQPEVAGRLLRQFERAQAISRAIKAANPAGILIAARGSSDNVAVYAKYVFQLRNRLPVALAAPSLFTHYAAPPRIDRYCVLGISQSGAAPDVRAVVEEGRRQGALTVAITNEADSPLAAAADFVIALQAGPERSVPASKTYTASLVAVAMLSQAIDPYADFAAALNRIPQALRDVEQHEAELQTMARLINGSRVIVLARGFNLATAEEIALKLTETSYVLARAWSAADFLHGPIAVMEPGFPVILVEAQGPTQPETREVCASLARLQPAIFQIGDGTPPLSGATTSVLLNTGLPESLTPFPLAVAGQLLALHLATSRGLDPDRPRTLTKVTKTR
ncbi:MAG TPA: SIS domain-containing protein [Candidatus Dormibacteraeota bacterium]|nr:SIS domain-containing protein [Candidatus Dormibacteraeota bacterium]